MRTSLHLNPGISAILFLLMILAGCFWASQRTAAQRELGPPPGTLAPEADLPAPALQSPSNGATGVSQSPTFTWTAVSGATSYRLLVATSASALPTDPTASTCSCVVNATPTGTSYSASGLTGGINYFWEVHGRSSAQFGTWSAKNGFTTLLPDTTLPTISAFSVSPSTNGAGQAFTISYTISDSGGSGLSRAELYRAPDSGGAPGTWSGLRSNSHSGNGPVSNSFSDVPPAVGVYWYGLHAIDNAGNVRLEPAPIRVTVIGNLSAPTLLSPSNGASGVSQSPTFSWSAVSGATSYRILVATSAAALPFDPTATACSCVINATPTATSYSASGLTGGINYYWEVHARNSTQFGNWSSTNSFTTGSADTTLPTISSFSVSPSTNGAGDAFTISYTISDSGGSGLNRAELYRAPDSGGVPGTWSGLRSNSHSGNGPVSSSFSDVPPAAGTYWYGLHAIDNAGNVRLEPAPIRVTVSGNLSPPTLSSPANGATGVSQSPTFSWAPVSGATSYRLLVATSAAALPTDPTASTCSCVINATPTDTSFSASGLTGGINYYWEVHGRNSTQFGTWSAKNSFTTGSAGDTTLPTISSFSVNPGNNGLGDAFTISYTISDSGGSGLSRAELYRAPDSGGAPGTWAGLRSNSHSGNGPVSSSFSDVPPANGTYWYGLHAIDNAGNVRLEPAPIRVSVTGNLSAPTLLTPANGASGISQPVSFSWTAVTGANAGYRLFVATSAAALPTDPTASSCSCVINATPSGTSYPASGLSSGTTYYWEVHGRSSSQYGNWSAKFSFTTRTGGDVTPPTISAFTVNQTNVNLGSPFVLNYAIADTGGSGLSRADLWRAPDNGGSPGTWSQIKSNAHSGNGPLSSSFTDTISTAGSYWYGLHVFDATGNVRYEPHPIGPVKVTAIQTTGCGTSDQIRARIQHQLQFLVNNPPIEYLPGSSWQASLVSFNLQAYDEVYYSALDLRGLATSTLARSTRFLNVGDIDSACSYSRRADRYIELMADTESTAVLIFNNRVTGISEIARAIASASCEIDVALASRNLGPKAKLAAEMICLPVDYALDRSLYGKDQALKNLKDTIRTQVLAKVILGTIPVPSLGGKTIDEYLEHGINHEIGSPRLYALIGEVLSNPSTKSEVMRWLAFLGDQALIDYGIERYAGELLGSLQDSLTIQSNSPQRDGFAATATTSSLGITSTSPTRDGAYISTTLSTLTVTFSEPISLGSQLVTLSDSNGLTVPMAGRTVSGYTLSVSLGSSLALGKVYTVTVPSDAARNASGGQNQQYSWSFSTPPSALSVGTNVIVANTGGIGINLRSNPSFLPDGSNVISTVPEGQQLQVIGGPVLADGFTWWNVRDDNNNGWSATGNWLSPKDLEGLRIGVDVTIANTSGLGLDLRDAPSTTATKLANLADGTTMRVLSGPYYVDGYVWWNVNGEAGSGYVPVAYWLFPVSTSDPIPTPTPTQKTIQFRSANYGVSEGDGQMTIIVTRSGDVSEAASVDLTISEGLLPQTCDVANGIASRRCDFMFGANSLMFAPGETSKAISLGIVDDAYAEGSESVSISLVGATGASLGTQSTSTITIFDNDSASGSNPIDLAGFFVTEHYYDFLNRVPDANGLAFWTNEIAQCLGNAQCVETKRINVSAAYFLSIEFQETGYLVERIYKTSYGDGTNNSVIGGNHTIAVPIIKFNEFLPDTEEISQGVVVGGTNWQQALENNKQAYTDEFVQRSRFITALPISMTPAAFVDKLNSNAGGPLSTADRNQLVNDLTAGAKTRAQVLRAVAENSNLVRTESNRAFVLMQYFGYLRRSPSDTPDSDYSGYDFWLQKLNQFNGSFVNAEMVKSFIVSGEYRNRFGR